MLWNILEQGVSFIQNPFITAEGSHIERFDLTDGRIYKIPAFLRPAFNQGKMVRRKHNRTEMADDLRHAGFRYAIEDGGAFMVVDVDNNRLFPFTGTERKLQAGIILVESDQFIVFSATKRASSGKEPDAFQQIGLTLSIVTVNDVDTLFG